MKYFSFLFLFFSVILSCTHTQKVSNQNLSALYRKDLQILHPEFTVFHKSDSISELHFKIDAGELLFTRPYNEHQFSCNVKVSCFLKSSFEAKEIIDSSFVKMTDTSPDNTLKRNFVGHLAFKANTPNIYLLEIHVTDLNRNQIARAYINIDKSNKENAQNFFISHSENQLPFFHNYFETTDTLEISHAGKNINNLFVRYYNRDFPVASPPFSITPARPFEYRADSAYTITVNDKNNFHFSFSKEGFYHLLIDTSKKEGLSLFNFYQKFPELSTSEHLAEPLIYLTSKQEFNEIMKAENKKAAAEEFWTRIGGNQSRAKDLIKKYYSRVKDANNYFTSYLEGWKTDRGMVYIIYGAPNIIYKTSNSESWVYGEENNFMSLTYTFLKVKNPFSDNDYTLDRSTVYKNSWYRAVEVWRQGRIYLEN